MESVQSNTADWKAYYDSSSPHLDKPPDPYAGVQGLPKLAILRSIRPDKLVPAIQASTSSNYLYFFVSKVSFPKPVFPC